MWSVQELLHGIKDTEQLARFEESVKDDLANPVCGERRQDVELVASGNG